jgi:hypothetical protein
MNPTPAFLSVSRIYAAAPNPDNHQLSSSDRNICEFLPRQTHPNPHLYSVPICSALRIQIARHPRGRLIHGIASRRAGLVRLVRMNLQPAIPDPRSRPPPAKPSTPLPRPFQGRSDEQQ